MKNLSNNITFGNIIAELYDKFPTMRISINLFLIVVVSVYSYSCRSTRYVNFNFPVPPEIIFSEDVQNILIADRTLQERENLNVIEGVISGELPGEDKTGAGILMESYRNEVNGNGRYEVKIYKERLKGSSIIAQLQKPLEWSAIDELVEITHADIIVLVEAFDSNTRIVSFNEITRRQENAITAGMRIYDPVTRQIVDQELFKQHFRQSASPNTPFSIPKDLRDRSGAIASAAQLAGISYAKKLAPGAIRIRREFYSRGKRDREVGRGARYADVGNWEEAIEIWKNALPNTRRRKDGGRLSYNIAVGYEVLGQLEEAVLWAERSFTDYRNKRGRSYVNILNRRLRAQ